MMRTIPVRALVIDDDHGVCRKTAAWLREAACDVVTFDDPAQALEHVRQAACQIVFVDLRLPGTDGAEVIAAVHALLPAVRLVAMGAFPDVPRVVAAMRAGAHDLLEKPIQREPLLATLERQLRQIGLGIRSEDEFNRQLGARLRATRGQSEQTLAAVAEKCGLTAAQLSQIELGKSATSTWSLARICSALGTPMDRLLRDL